MKIVKSEASPSNQNKNQAFFYSRGYLDKKIKKKNATHF